MRSHQNVTAMGTVVQADPLWVSFDGEPGAEPVDMPRLGSYVPAVGDRVVLLYVGSLWTVVGRSGRTLTGARAAPGTHLASFRRSVSFSIPNSSTTVVPMDVADYDPLGIGTGTQFVVPWPGFWRFSAQLQHSGSAGGGQVLTGLRRNDGSGSDETTDWGGQTRGGNGTEYVRSTKTKYMNGVDDFMEVVAFQDSGAAEIVSGGDDNTYLEIAYAGPSLEDDQ